MSTLPPAPTAANADAVRRLRAALSKAGYTEANVLKQLGVPDLPPARMRQRAGGAVLWRTRGGSPLDALVRLFVLRQPASNADTRKALGDLAPDEAAGLGLLTPSGDGFAAAVELLPVGTQAVAADWDDGQPDAVLGAGTGARALARLAIRRKVGAALDLACGAGALAVQAAAHSGRVVAADANPRALAFARFNAAVNGLSNVEFAEGELYAAVAGRQFDLIHSVPAAGVTPGVAGRAAFEAAVRGAADHLRPGGFAQIACQWTTAAGQDWRPRVFGWVDGDRCNGWVLSGHTEDVAGYAARRVAELEDDPAAAAAKFADWAGAFAREKVEGVGFGLVTLRRSTGGPQWMRVDPLPDVVGAPGAAGAAIEAGFDRTDALERLTDDQALMQLRVRHAPSLKWEQVFKAVAGRWAPEASRLRLTDGLGFHGDVEPIIADFVGRCRGDKMLGELIADIANASKIPPQQLAAGVLRTARRLIETGVLIPVEDMGLPAGDMFGVAIG